MAAGTISHPCIEWKIRNIFMHGTESDIFYLDAFQYKLIIQHFPDGEEYISIQLQKISIDKSSYIYDFEVIPFEMWDFDYLKQPVAFTKKYFSIYNSTPQEIWRKSVRKILDESKSSYRKFYFLFTSTEIPRREIEKSKFLFMYYYNMITLLTSVLLHNICFRIYYILDVYYTYFNLLLKRYLMFNQNLLC